MTTVRMRLGALLTGFLVALGSLLTANIAQAVQAFTNAYVANAGLAEVGTSRPTG